jgi:hypothetical protein
MYALRLAGSAHVHHDGDVTVLHDVGIGAAECGNTEAGAAAVIGGLDQHRGESAGNRLAAAVCRLGHVGGQLGAIRHGDVLRGLCDRAGINRRRVVVDPFCASVAGDRGALLRGERTRAQRCPRGLAAAGGAAGGRAVCRRAAAAAAEHDRDAEADGGEGAGRRKALWSLFVHFNFLGNVAQGRILAGNVVPALAGPTYCLSLGSVSPKACV